MLTFIGMRPVQEPYEVIGQISRLVYFRYFPLHCLLERFWDVILRCMQFGLFEDRSAGEGASEKNSGKSYDGGVDLR